MRHGLAEAAVPICNVCKWRYVEEGDVCPECLAKMAAARGEVADAGDVEEIEFEVKKLIAGHFRSLVITTMVTVMIPFFGYVAVAEAATDLRRMKRLGYAGYERVLTWSALVFAALWAVGVTLLVLQWML